MTDNTASRRGIIKFVAFALAAVAAAFSVSSCGSASAPEFHAIEYDSRLGTLDDEDGADAFDHSLDHADSRYYVINDYYSMKSGGGLHILTGFDTYQQTTEYSCGAASALMVLNWFGVGDCNEMDICTLAGTDTSTGTSPEGLAGFFESLGWETEYHADTDYRFESIGD